MLCQDCTYGHPDGENVICKRYPPTPVIVPIAPKVLGGPPQIGINFIHPTMKWEDYCGEHKPDIKN